mmetsp:Transcript_47916/g.128388  ORF Transcript_47916/g.128388 Transcript_47916/m.128388 type:complete len:350 (+) Transcript_47916:263-1312(+)
MLEILEAGATVKSHCQRSLRVVGLFRKLQRHRAATHLGTEVVQKSLCVWRRRNRRLVPLRELEAHGNLLGASPLLQEVDDANVHQHHILLALPVYEREAQLARRGPPRPARRGILVQVLHPHSAHGDQQTVIHQVIAAEPRGVQLQSLHDRFPLLVGERHRETSSRHLALVVDHSVVGPRTLAAPQMDVPDTLVHNLDLPAVGNEGLVVSTTLQVIQPDPRTLVAQNVAHHHVGFVRRRISVVQVDLTEKRITLQYPLTVATCNSQQRLMITLDLFDDVSATRGEGHEITALATTRFELPDHTRVFQEVAWHTVHNSDFAPQLVLKSLHRTPCHKNAGSRHSTCHQHGW